MSCVAVSIRGKVWEIGNDRLQDILDKNRYMNEIYPNEQSRQALTVFQLYEGTGEWFDLSQKPIERTLFTIENRHKKVLHCGNCLTVCPQKAVIRR